MSLYEQLGSGGMEPDDFHLLGISLARMGNPKGSVEVWENALKQDPDHPATLYEIIQVHLRAERFDAAASAALRLAGDPIWRDRAIAMLGQIEFSRDNPGKAVEFWKQVLTDRKTELPRQQTPPVNGKDLARALLRIEQSAEARTRLLAILADGPDAEASWLLSRAYLQTAARTEALAALQAAGSFSDENSTLHEPAIFVGAKSCAPCHSVKFQTQQNSRHARTFHRATELRDLKLPEETFRDPADPRVGHELRQLPNQLLLKTQTVGQLYEAVIDYAFGSGDRGKTMVGHDREGQHFELRLSVYREKTAEAKWDVTSGHSRRPSSDHEFLGAPLTSDGVRRCFSCHVTNPEMSINSPLGKNVDRAIGCEKCHGPGGNHLLAVSVKFPDLAISRPSLVSGSRIVRICAECHAPRGKNLEPDDPASARFPGRTLTWSRCYTESQGSLDCVTCHNPHRDAETDPTYYEAKCTACHSSDQAKTRHALGDRSRRFELSQGTAAPTCPVNPAKDCLSCHMPKVEGVVPHSSFTDHFIRIHRE
jgi:tetratricopeptide (TPR) repeat protein